MLKKFWKKNFKKVNKNFEKTKFFCYIFKKSFKYFSNILYILENVEQKVLQKKIFEKKNILKQIFFKYLTLYIIFLFKRKFFKFARKFQNVLVLAFWGCQES